MARTARNLTEAAIKGIKPAQKRRPNGDTYHETVKAVGYGIPGLSLRVTERRKTFRFTYRLTRRASMGTKSCIYTIGEWPTISLEEAVDKGRELRRLVLAGKDPKREEQGAVTFGAAVEEFIEKHCVGLRRTEHNPRNRTWREQKRQLAYFTDELGDRGLSEITRDDIARILEEIAARAPGRADRVRAALHKFYRWAITHGRCNGNPAAATPRVHTTTKRVRYLEHDEIPAAWKAAKALGYPCGPIVKLLLLTGCRLDEIRSLRWSEVSLESGEIRLPADRVKNKLEHTVYLSREALRILHELPQRSDIVFRGETGKPVTFGSRSRARLLELSALPHWTPHDLRRTHAVLAGRCGVPVHIIERALNHKAGTYNGIVGNYQVDEHKPERRKAAELVGELVREILAGEESSVMPLHRAAA